MGVEAWTLYIYSLSPVAVSMVFSRTQNFSVEQMDISPLTKV